MSGTWGERRPLFLLSSPPSPLSPSSYKHKRTRVAAQRSSLDSIERKVRGEKIAWHCSPLIMSVCSLSAQGRPSSLLLTLFTLWSSQSTRNRSSSQVAIVLAYLLRSIDSQRSWFYDRFSFFFFLNKK